MHVDPYPPINRLARSLGLIPIPNEVRFRVKLHRPISAQQRFQTLLSLCTDLTNLAVHRGRPDDRGSNLFLLLLPSDIRPHLWWKKSDKVIADTLTLGRGPIQGFVFGADEGDLGPNATSFLCLPPISNCNDAAGSDDTGRIRGFSSG